MMRVTEVTLQQSHFVANYTELLSRFLGFEFELQHLLAVDMEKDA